LTNGQLAYATGLLLARRVLAKLGLDSKYEGCTEPDGEYFEVEPVEDGPRPFRAFLDVGLRRTTTGSRVFGALKGAVDGGLAVPYSESRFPGYSKSEKKADAELLSSYIYGGHVTEYMEYLIEEDDEAYKKQFAAYIADDVEPSALEDIYKEAHGKIRSSPAPVKKERKPLTEEQKNKLKAYRHQPLTYAQRKERVAAKKAAFAQQ
jgi:large subunit ribosomal protein L5e